MINGDKPIKDFLDKSELELLYDLKISQNDTLNKAKDVLETYIEKKGYVSLEEISENINDNKYIKILKKIYEILPIY